MDPRLKLLSYSSLLTLHSCPRKYELYKLKATEDVDSPAAERNQNVTFAFGHVVGDAIAACFEGISEEQIIWRMFRGWHADLADSDDKRKKNFYFSVLALQRLISLREAGFLDEYELLWYNGKPATELGFKIYLPDGFIFRGYVDAVLRHKITGKILVLECKTSSATNLNPTTYKNSAQAIGYSVVLDVVVPEINEYEVLYLIYLTKNFEYESHLFPKSYSQRAKWIQELLLDVEVIKMYAEVETFPMRGESCADWGRDCEYLSQCTLSNKWITKPANEVAIEAEFNQTFDIHITLADLIEGQMKKVTQSPELEFAGEISAEDAPTIFDGDTML